MEREDEPKEKEEKNESVWGLIKYSLIAILIVIPFRIYIAQPYVVDGSSMEPTFKNGDYLIVDQVSKNFSQFERGDVVIMRYPRDPSKFFIKRLIGFPGESIVIKEGQLFIERPQTGEVENIDEPYVVFSKKENFKMELKEDQYFVMGDNRAGSSDSRIWGSLPKENIVGKPILRLLPIRQATLFPGGVEK